jgi:hypothetical protein
MVEEWCRSNAGTGANLLIYPEAGISFVLKLKGCTEVRIGNKKRREGASEARSETHTTQLLPYKVSSTRDGERREQPPW